MKNVKNTYGVNFTESSTPPWKFPTFFKLYKWYQVEQSVSYRSKKREPPLPIYLALMVYLKTRKLEAIDHLSQLGLCISRNRFVQIYTPIGYTAIKLYSEKTAIVPINLTKDLFITAAVGNIDVNPKY